jgi:hypothetical protein
VFDDAVRAAEGEAVLSIRRDHDRFDHRRAHRPTRPGAGSRSAPCPSRSPACIISALHGTCPALAGRGCAGVRSRRHPKGSRAGYVDFGRPV